MLNTLTGLLGFANKYLGAAKAVTLFDEGMALHRDGKFKDAAPLIRESAELGYNNAMAVYGSMQLFGQGVKEDGNIALHWLRQAADTGHADARSVLGMALATGKAGIRRDMPQAIALLTECAANGDEKSQKMLDMISQRKGMFKKLRRE